MLGEISPTAVELLEVHRFDYLCSKIITLFQRIRNKEICMQMKGGTQVFAHYILIVAVLRIFRSLPYKKPA